MEAAVSIRVDTPKSFFLTFIQVGFGMGANNLEQSACSGDSGSASGKV